MIKDENLNDQQNNEKKDIDNEIGLYIHIPFCKSKCVYCDFCSFAGMEEKHEKYIDALLKEIDLYKDVVKDKVVKTIFIGGGTPTFLDISLIEKVMNKVKESFTFKNDINNMEITIEANPGTLNEEKLKRLKDLGINRLSMGLQSANDKTLKLLSRIHTFEECKNDVELAKKVGFNNINLDIMFSLPNETIDDVKNTINEVLKLDVNHISAYSLIIENGTKMAEMVFDENLAFPNEDADREIYYYICDTLKEKGYHQYEISNFAKSGYESKHNIIYWKAKEYLGLGLAAHSYLNGYRFSNTNDLNRYISRIINENKITYINGKKELQTTEDKMSEFMFLGLRMLDGVSKNEFKERFKVDINDVYGDVIEDLVDEGLLTNEGDVIKLTKYGIDISNVVFAEFMIEE